MSRAYKIVSGASKSTPSTPSSRELADWLAKDGQLLLPLVALLEKGERAIDEVIDVMGRATIEAVLRMSAEAVAGPKEQGRRDAGRELYWHGVQAGRVALKERQLRVEKPRLRKKRPRNGEPGEVEIPAYTALQADGRLADRMLELVLHGVSTREYETVLPAMADQAGVSKSEVSRETIESGTRVLRELSERDLSGLDVLVVYLDGIVFGDYHVLAAVGVDAEGRKHVLGVRGGASENAEVTVDLLEDLVARGLRADRRRLFVLDGAKALRQAGRHRRAGGRRRGRLPAPGAAGARRGVSALGERPRFDHHCWDLYARVPAWYEEDRLRPRADVQHVLPPPPGRDRGRRADPAVARRGRALLPPPVDADAGADGLRRAAADVESAKLSNKGDHVTANQFRRGTTSFAFTLPHRDHIFRFHFVQLKYFIIATNDAAPNKAQPIATRATLPPSKALASLCSL